MQPDHVNNIIQGASALQIVILIFLGCILIISLFAGINWVLSIRLKGIENLDKSIISLNLKIEKIAGALLTDTELAEKIDHQILKHKTDCYKHKHGCS